MADAYFLNAAPVVISVNLNTALQNQILTPQISITDKDVADLAAWEAPIAKTPNEGVFGGNDAENLLLVISQGSSRYRVWEIHSSVSTTLSLYFFILGDQVVGMDQTGSTVGIRITAASNAAVARVLNKISPGFF